MNENYDISGYRPRKTWDPVPHLAALIDGLREVAQAGTDEGIRIRLAELLTGPYGALRGGLLLDEPGREDATTGRAIREALGTSRDSGPDVFRAAVYGDSYPALIEAAGAEARGFYGPDAPLVVEHTGPVWSTIGTQARVNRGEYNTVVTIRCTRLPEGWDVP